MNIILLTAAQAEEVAGPSASVPHAALAPAPLTDGRFYLGEGVLTDPAHAAHRAMLAACPLVPLESVAALVPAEADEG